MTSINARTVYENEDTNLFIFSINNGIANFIEGISPCAHHNMQSIPVENLITYLNDYGFTFCEWLTEMIF